MLSRRYTREPHLALTDRPEKVPTFGPGCASNTGGGVMAWWKRSTTAARDESAAADPNMPLLRLGGITQVFKGDAAGEAGETRALDDVTLDIHPGDYIPISGPSGRRESTMPSILPLLAA